jgi:hypothetical protein
LKEELHKFGNRTFWREKIVPNKKGGYIKGRGVYRRGVCELVSMLQVPVMSAV